MQVISTLRKRNLVRSASICGVVLISLTTASVGVVLARAQQPGPYTPTSPAATPTPMPMATSTSATSSAGIGDCAGNAQPVRRKPASWLICSSLREARSAKALRAQRASRPPKGLPSPKGSSPGGTSSEEDFPRRGSSRTHAQSWKSSAVHAALEACGVQTAGSIRYSARFSPIQALAYRLCASDCARRGHLVFAPLSRQCRVSSRGNPTHRGGQYSPPQR
jgi:hypothetical protein